MAYPENLDIAAKVEALKAFHENILRFEKDKQIEKDVMPALDSVTKILQDITNFKK